MALQKIYGLRFIESQSLGDGLWSTDAGQKLSESKLNLAYTTTALNNSITGLKEKKILLFNEVPSVAVSTGNTSKDVTTGVTAASFYGTFAGSSSVTGVVVSAPDNKCVILDAATKDAIHPSGLTVDVYGRLTYSGGVATLSFYYMDGAVETAYAFGANTNVSVLFPESYNLNDAPYRAFVQGVGYVEGMPAAHTHDLGDIGLSGTGAAASIGIDNTISGFAATTVQGALDEIVSDLSATTGAGTVGYDNTTSGLTATTVQTAIDEVVDEFVAETDLASTSGAGTVGFDVTDGIIVGSATTVQGAIRELETDLDAVSGASLIGFDNTTAAMAGAPATVEAAINTLDSRLDSVVGVTEVIGQDLSAQINGTNDTFTVTASKYTAGTLRVFRQGLNQVKKPLVSDTGAMVAELVPGSGTFKFAADNIPQVGENVIVDYKYS